MARNHPESDEKKAPGNDEKDNPRNANGAVQSGNKTHTGTPPQNEVDLASEDSFPASDPPSSMSSGASPSA